MENESSTLSQAYIAAQKKRLLELRTALLDDAQASQSEARTLQNSTANHTQSSGDGAQRNALRDNDAALIAHNAVRMRCVDRALQKIEEGNYGLSDLSGAPIPKSRLDALPESLVTLDEADQA